MKISVIIPTFNGGALLDKTLQVIFSQTIKYSYEVIIIDSGSGLETFKIIKKYPVKLFQISSNEFNHGLTRDLGARKAKGEFLIFINQDAEPVNNRWMDLMVKPLILNKSTKASQGLILERNDNNASNFFWHSGGERFYFTSETKKWMQHYNNIGFSTVNCCIRKEVWKKYPFGYLDIAEDKSFQRQVQVNGNEIVYADGCVFHTHDYNYRQLKNRCQDEGYAWSLLGEKYSLPQAIKDTFIFKNYKELLIGIYKHKIKKWSEFVYPFMRPFWVYKGNHFNKRLRS
jgi:rhamnosyltransferase